MIKKIGALLLILFICPILARAYYQRASVDLGGSSAFPVKSLTYNPGDFLYTAQGNKMCKYSNPYNGDISVSSSVEFSDYPSLNINCLCSDATNIFFIGNTGTSLLIGKLSADMDILGTYTILNSSGACIILTEDTLFIGGYTYSNGNDILLVKMSKNLSNISQYIKNLAGPDEIYSIAYSTAGYIFANAKMGSSGALMKIPVSLNSDTNAPLQEYASGSQTVLVVKGKVYILDSKALHNYTENLVFISSKTLENYGQYSRPGWRTMAYDTAAERICVSVVNDQIQFYADPLIMYFQLDILQPLSLVKNTDPCTFYDVRQGAYIHDMPETISLAIDNKSRIYRGMYYKHSISYNNHEWRSSLRCYGIFPIVYTPASNSLINIRQGETKNITIHGSNLANCSISFSDNAISTVSYSCTDDEITATVRYSSYNTVDGYAGMTVTESAFSLKTHSANCIRLNPSTPDITWAGIDGYISDAIEPETIPIGSTATFKIRYYDYNWHLFNSGPLLNIYDSQGNALIESCTMQLSIGEEIESYKVYTLDKYFSSGEGCYKYNFSAKTQYNVAAGSATEVKNSFFVSNPVAVLSWQHPSYFILEPGDEYDFQMAFYDQYNHDAVEPCVCIALSSSSEYNKYTLNYEKDLQGNKKLYTKKMAPAAGFYKYYYSCKTEYNCTSFNLPVSSFAVTYPPTNIVNTSIQDNSYSASNKVRLSWSASDSDGTLNYQLYFGSSPENLELIHCGKESSYILAGLAYGQAYFWQVEAVNIYGASSRSAVYAFSTISAVERAFNYPNPFNPLRRDTNIVFNMQEAGSAEMSIYTELGDLCRQETFTGLARGANEIVFDGKDGSGNVLYNGTYVCFLRKKYSSLEETDKCRLLVIK